MTARNGRVLIRVRESCTGNGAESLLALHWKKAHRSAPAKSSLVRLRVVSLNFPYRQADGLGQHPKAREVGCTAWPYSQPKSHPAATRRLLLRSWPVFPERVASRCDCLPWIVAIEASCPDSSGGSRRSERSAAPGVRSLAEPVRWSQRYSKPHGSHAAWARLAAWFNCEPAQPHDRAHDVRSRL